MPQDTRLIAEGSVLAMRTRYAVFLVAIALAFFFQVEARAADPFLEEGLQIRIDELELAHLRGTNQITPEKYQERAQAVKQHYNEYKQRVAQLPREQQQALVQQLKTQFEVVFPPIQQKWNAEVLRLREEAKAASASRAKEMEAAALAASQAKAASQLKAASQPNATSQPKAVADLENARQQMEKERQAFKPAEAPRRELPVARPPVPERVNTGFSADIGETLLVLLLPTLILLWLVNKILNRRSRLVRRSNHEALQVFGDDKDTRERAILDAFDTPDFTFRYTGVNRNSGNKMRFVLLRNIKSFRRGDIEALRFAYLAFNRGLIDKERFHWFRFSAIYAGGQTNPSEWKFLGLFSFLKSSQGAIDQARACVANFAQANGGTDIEAQALAAIQKLAMDHPSDDLYRDLQRRFVEGSYWLTKGEIKSSAFAPSSSPYSLTFGLFDGTNTELVYSGDGSVMTIAPPGSGKTQCNVLPNLLRWAGPAVVLDVKGELFDQTSRWRAANVGPVIKFSPLDPANSACYNPLTAVRRESSFIWEDSRFLASMMIVPVAKEPFWEDKAREILTAIIADVSFWNAPDERPMSKVLSLVNRNGWTDFVQRLIKNPELATMRDEGTNLAHMEAKTLDGALQTAKASLSAWVGERIARVTRRSDWSPLDLRNGKNLTIYICIKPNEIDSYMSLLRVVIAQHIRGLTSGEIPPRDAAPILFLLDELPRLKHMAPVEEALEVGRGYGIKLWMISQSIGQMRTAYPNAEGMMGSCAVRSFMNPSLQDGTAKMLAEQIGYRKGEEHGGKDRAMNASPQLVVDPTQLAGAEFKELQIVIGVGTKPAKVKKVYAYKDQTLTANMGAVQPAHTEPATI